MDPVFLCGPLCHAPLLAAVLGHALPGRAARLGGHTLLRADGAAVPQIAARAGALVDGLLIEGCTPEDLARLDFYQAGFGLGPRRLSVQTDAGPVTAVAHLPGQGALAQGDADWRADWRLDAWVARHGAAAVAAAGDVMALMGEWPPELVASRQGAMLTRGAGRVRARAPQPAALRRKARPEDVSVAARSTAYARFFAVEDWRLSWRQFDGTMGAPQDRAVFVMADAVTVLPYDPLRDRVLLIEQFRSGPFARGDLAAWQLEAIAGRIDPGETPQEAARREALEEAGLTLGPLLPVAEYYPSPGGVTEYLYSYVALTDLPDGTAGVFGAAEEAEDIRGHLISFDRMMDLAATGELTNGPMLLTALWLQRERPRLRAEVATP